MGKWKIENEDCTLNLKILKLNLFASRFLLCYAQVKGVHVEMCFLKRLSLHNSLAQEIKLVLFCNYATCNLSF